MRVYKIDIDSLELSFACATFIQTVPTFQSNFVPTSKKNIGVYAAVLVGQGKPEISMRRSILRYCVGMINSFGVHLLRYLNNISIWWHAVGTTALVIGTRIKLWGNHCNYNICTLSYPCGRADSPIRALRIFNVYRRNWY